MLTFLNFLINQILEDICLIYNHSTHVHQFRRGVTNRFLHLKLERTKY